MHEEVTLTQSRFHCQAFVFASCLLLHLLAMAQRKTLKRGNYKGTIVLK